MQILDIFHRTSDAHTDPVIRHPDLKSFHEPVQQIAKMILGNIVGHHDKGCIIIEERRVVADRFKINLQLEADPAPFHGIHRIKIPRLNKYDLESSVYIEIRQQSPSTIFRIFRGLYGLNQCAGYFIVRDSLQQDPHAEVFYHIKERYVPRDGHEREVIVFTECPYLPGDFHYIHAGVDDEPGSPEPAEFLYKLKLLLRLSETQSGGHRQILACKILQNRHIFDHEDPADRVCPAVPSCFQFHLVA